MSNRANALRTSLSNRLLRELNDLLRSLSASAIRQSGPEAER